MGLFNSRRMWRIGMGAACLGGVLTGVAGPAATSYAATPQGASGSITAGSDYLALGDSVSFGYRESNTTPPPNYARAASFVGYPEDVGSALDVHVVNLACPGETSASFIVENVQSNGCENSPGGGPGYRTFFPLHRTYVGTQLHEAVRYINNHPNTKLVSLMIGANDAFLCQETTADHCASEIGSVLRHISDNVATILTAIRTQAGYTGEIVILNYYALDYTSVIGTAGSISLNKAMDRAARPFGVKIADGFGAFQTAARHSGGNSCTAGLLTQLTPATGGGCGVHPSAAGQAVLALAVERAIAG